MVVRYRSFTGLGPGKGTLAIGKGTLTIGKGTLAVGKGTLAGPLIGPGAIGRSAGALLQGRVALRRDKDKRRRLYIVIADSPRYQFAERCKSNFEVRVRYEAPDMNL